jgi:VIT1/CCC1 family predicted Fe2+/Mn2+ transporter
MESGLGWKAPARKISRGVKKEAGVRSILRHREGHRTGRIGWLRAAVLGANELGLSDKLAARPLQAALASAATFAVGALLPILAVMLPPQAWVVPVVSGASLICLAALGALATQVGGGSAWRGAMRVAFWGALAMVATAAVGALFGTTVG